MYCVCILFSIFLLILILNIHAAYKHLRQRDRNLITVCGLLSMARNQLLHKVEQITSNGQDAFLHKTLTCNIYAGTA